MKISVKVKPNSRQERLEKVSENSFLVWVKEKPQDGRANQAAIKILAEYLDIPTSQVLLIKGQTSRQKVFEIS